jgi:Site-specific recombinase XerD
MSATVNLKLWKYRPQKDGTYPIYVRITKNRKSSWQSTNISVRLKDWDDAKGKVKPSHPNSARLNALLKQIELKYQNDVVAIENEDLSVGIRRIKTMIYGQDEKNFMSVAYELLSRYKSEGKISFHDKAASIIRKFRSYMNSADFSFQDIDIRLLINYQQYLIEEYHNKPNSVNSNLKFIKTVFLYAQRMEYIPLHVNPFLKYKFLKVQTERGFLTPEEIAAIENLDLEGKHNLARAKDIVLFQYYSGGLRISDVLLLQPDNIYDNRVFITIKKTGKQTSHKLMPKALEIADRYMQMGKEFIFGYLSDGLDLDDLIKVDAEISSKTALINKYLKEIGELCGIKKTVSTHIFRHSFATNALQQGMSLDVLQSILNHSNIRETQIYAKVLDKKVDAEIDKLNL